MKEIKHSVSLLGVLVASLGLSFGQTNLQFTSVDATVEQAIILHWASQSNHIYQVQYADALATNAGGSTTWQTLYDAYPSQGTNTFIGDFGNYDADPIIPHPKYSPMRFYRILDEATNTAASPFVMIISPTNGSTLSGQITISVVATSSVPVLNTVLFVDGQQMDPSDDGSNYLINTCEWPNGPHTLFATATARSALPGQSGVFPIYVGYAVSAYVPVTFNNLISQIAFSQTFFQPSLGQTQQVTATFGANCNWTLQIQDENSNTVRTASGAGDSMSFLWDGTGNGGTNIPDGVYNYLISAQTNGAPDIITGGGSGGGSPPPPSFASDVSELWAVSPNSESVVPLALYPPGFDTNNLTIFAASPSEVQTALSASAPRSTTGSAIGESSSSYGVSPAYAGPSGQTSQAPTRPPTAPTKNAAGTYAIGYYTWETPGSANNPKNGVPPPTTQSIHLDGSSGLSGVDFDDITIARTTSEYMERIMVKSGWARVFAKADARIPVNSIRRPDLGYNGGAIFTGAVIGLFIDHGDYGTDPDYSPGSSGSQQTYFRSDADGSGDNAWLRMCQFGFGGDLKWMGMLACNSLRTFSSMSTAGAIPLSTTHLVCGTASIAAVGETSGANWAKNMLKKKQTIVDAWFNAGRTEYTGQTYANSIIFRVAGYPECMGDTVQTNTAPTSPSTAPGNLTKQDSTVYP